MNPLSGDVSVRRLAAITATLAASVLVLSACERADADVVARVVVLQACDTAVRKRVDDAPAVQFSVKYVALDESPREAPHVVGFVELQSSTLSQEELTQFARGFATECRTRYSAGYDINEPDSVNKLAEFLGQVQERRVSFRDLDGTGGPVDPDQLYLSLKDGQVQVLFNTESP